ncbi:dihydrofolate reductase family protein [Actinomycetospora flava]|uniref:Dihydrofolate reductase family protein n=1 Tax=Actinomycetospora flava TaxID=3129232 RepID=A0ABU8MCK4_9PSEU
MQQVWPPPVAELDDAALEELYTYPAGSALRDSWLAVNFVSSLDGGIEVEGRSAGLSTPADRRVFALAHDLADVVLLGAGTAVAEDYPGLRPDATTAARRARHGLAPVAPLALVTSGSSLPADATSIVDVAVPSIVVTSAAGAGKRQAWEDAGAEVIVAGEGDVDLADAVAQLAARGLRRIDCEGGPGLVGTLLACDLVDEIRVSYAPFAVAGHAARMARSAEALSPPARFDVGSLLVDDGTLLVRYLRRR